MIDILLALICGIGYRLRGSAGQGGWVEKIIGFPVGTFLGRFFWCIPVAALTTPSLLLFVPYVVLAYIGVMFGYWGGEFDLEAKANQNWKNYARLTIRGCFVAFPLALFTGAWLGVVAGCLFVPYYKLSIPISRFLKLPMLKGFSEWGEFLLGTFIAYGLIYG
jgi:hypothetical protein